MSARPYHKRYHSDALTGYRGLTLEQRGAYTTILDLLYDSDEEALPGLERWMAGQLGVSARKWRVLRDELAALGKIVVLPDGRITNPRYLRERAKQEELSEARAESGRKGGRKRQGLLPLDDENDCSPSRVQPEFAPSSTPENELNRNRTEDERSEKGNDINGGSEANASVLPLYARASQSPDTRVREEEDSTTGESRNRETPTPIVDEVPLSREVLTTIVQSVARVGGVTLRPERPTAFLREIDQVRTWLRDGIDIERTAIPAIAARMARMGDDETVSSLKFYDQTIRKAHAKTLNGTADQPALSPEDRQANMVKAIEIYRRIGRGDDADTMQRELDRMRTTH